jgi:hypothetical protein
MTQRNITALEALEYLRQFSKLFARTPKAEWSKLPFYAFYRDREGLWVDLNNLSLCSSSVKPTSQELSILQTFFDLINEIQKNEIEKNILNQNKYFWWVNILWVSTELFSYSA